MRWTLSDVIDRMKGLLNDSDTGDYAKVFLKDFISDLETIKNDKKTMLIDLLDEFKHTNFCNKNFSDCLDCYNHKECDAIRNVMELVSQNKLIEERNTP